jgi:uncharacterized integral membrane protein (TIGR00698 family)
LGSAAAAAEKNRTFRWGQLGVIQPGRWVLVTGAAACLWWAVSPGIALLGGMLVALVLGDARVGEVGARPAQLLLKISVVGLGAGMNLGVVWRVGAQTAGYTAVGIALTLALGRWLGRRAHLPRDVALLVTVGTAICGGSAIAAIAGVIRPKRQDVTVALTTVFLLNALALLIFPGIGHALGFSQRQFGLWAALAIHDTSSVVGAAMAYGREAVSVATTVKLTRALWIVPVAVAVGYRRRVSGEKSVDRRRLPLPIFILGFLAAAALFTYWAPLAAWRLPVTAGAQRLFAVTLFLIGSGFSRAALRAVGIRPLVIGVALWLAVGTATAGALLSGWIH